MNKTDEQLAEEARRFFNGKTPAQEFDESHKRWLEQGRDE